MFRKIALIFLAVACSSAPHPPEPTLEKKGDLPVSVMAPKEFNRSELIQATQLLTKIFDQEIPALECVPDTGEASLLLRTIRPRMEVVEDDLEAMLDNTSEIQALIRSCEQNCTCGYIDDLFKEHQVMLTKQQTRMLKTMRAEKELSRCLSSIQKSFCQSELFRTLEKEKADFSFEEGP